MFRIQEKLLLYQNAETLTSSVADFRIEACENQLVVGKCFRHLEYKDADY